MEFELEIGFIDHLQDVSTNNYKTIDNFHTLQNTTANAKSFQSAVTSFFPVKDLLHQLNLLFADPLTTD
jgi:hypothetical protein